MSGTLHLGQEATLRLYRGNVVDGTFRALRGVAALREIFFRDAWSFEVILGPSAPGRPIERLSNLIIEALHLRDEWIRVARTIYRRVDDPRGIPTVAAIDPAIARLDGVQQLRQIVATEGPPTATLVEQVLEALRLGVIERVEAPQPAPAPTRELGVVAESPPAPGPMTEEEAYIANAEFDDLLHFARRSMRKGDLATVEAAVRAALRLDPESRIAQQNLRRVLQLRAP